MADDDPNEFTEIWKTIGKLQGGAEREESVPFEVPQFTCVKPEEYQKCIKPRELLAKYPYGDELSIKQLKRELEFDRVQAVCHEAIFNLGEETNSLANTLIDNWVWTMSIPDVESDFWETCYLEIRIPKSFSSYNFQYLEPQGWIRFYDVRFWPDTEALNLLSGSIIEKTPQSEDRPPVSNSDLEKWHKVFLGVYEQSSEEIALKSARAMFSDKHVSRQKVRDLRGPQKRGKPAKR